MLLLSIDTSTTAISVALHDGNSVVAERNTLDSRAHAERLSPNVVECLRDIGATPAELTHLVVGVGPGPFTGLRVGIMTAKTMAYALQLPLGGLCSLDALAWQWATSTGAAEGDRVLVATDARRKEVYTATYAVAAGPSGLDIERRREPEVSRAADLPEAERALPAIGAGPALYPAALPHAVTGADLTNVSAGALAELAVRRGIAALTLDPPSPAWGDGLAPLYLRRPDADPSAAQRKSTLGA